MPGGMLPRYALVSRPPCWSDVRRKSLLVADGLDLRHPAALVCVYSAARNRNRAAQIPSLNNEYGTVSSGGQCKASGLIHSLLTCLDGSFEMYS